MSRATALLEATLVTFLWSTSYVLIKIGLNEIPPLSFAAYRYVTASLLLILLFHLNCRKTGKYVRVDSKNLLAFFAMGVFGYFFAQGLQFVGLFYLPAVTVSFLLNYTPIFVLILSMVFLNEKPSRTQLLGIILSLIGVYIFFLRVQIPYSDFLGILITLISGLGWAVYMILTRYYLKLHKVDIMELTTYSMSFGSLLLFITAICTEKRISISLSGWAIILWLSVVNTALAFLLWNHALKTIRAFEQSILQNTMLIQITVMTWLFLKEIITLEKIIGIILVFIGVLIVQIRKNNSDKV